MNTFLIIIAVALVIWIVGTLIAIRGIEEPKYAIVEKREGYEIREYESYIVAEVEVEGNMSTALSSGFRELAGYIFGGNTTKSSIAMTAPVMDTMKASEKIAMTAPVMDTLSSTGKHIIAFMMPSSYTMDTLPKPDNTNIHLRLVDRARKAVLRYSWYATPARVEAKKQILAEFLVRDSTLMSGAIVSAQYDPPLSFPPLRRNETMVDIK
jgi:hypothetical protein